jgi:hypothetical protein
LAAATAAAVSATATATAAPVIFQDTAPEGKALGRTPPQQQSAANNTSASTDVTGHLQYPFSIHISQIPPLRGPWAPELSEANSSVLRRFHELLLSPALSFFSARRSIDCDPYDPREACMLSGEDQKKK